jgi:outer membrane lipoprotein SlyB
MKKIVKFFVVAVSMLILTGCENSEPAITEDTTPFEKAIAQYCRSKHYGMAVKKFVTLKVTGDNADAVAKMQAASVTYGIAVKWEFKFQKQKGKWKVKFHNAK